jgi:hypothetical protein
MKSIPTVYEARLSRIAGEKKVLPARLELAQLVAGGF